MTYEDLLKELEPIKPFREHKDWNDAVRAFYTEYKDDAIDIYRENPFVLVTDFGMPFHYFRHKEGTDLYRNPRTIIPTFDMHKKEVYALLTDLLRQNESLGHSYLTLHTLWSKARKYFPFTTERKIKAYLKAFSDDFYMDSNNGVEIIALKDTKDSEEYILERVSPLIHEDICPTYDFEFTDSNSLIKEQNDAIRLLMTGGITILTGGPGTGKTTTLKTLVEAYNGNYEHRSICLAAPTGKAARRLTEAIGDGRYDAHTLDSLIWKYKFSGQKIDIDLCIIDESSMLSIETFKEFLKYINPLQIILVGDTDQLPSIGAGNILHDLIAMGLPTARLTRNFRSDEGSTINYNANVIRNKSTEFKFDKDFRFLSSDITRDGDIERFASLLYSRNSVILTPYRYEAEKINRLIHERMFHTEGYEIGDRVMFLKNRRDRGYVNGDTGVITDIIDRHYAIRIDNLERTEIYIPCNHTDDISYAYALTVHKSQGSEYDTVIILIPTGSSKVFSRKLLYTAVTRAKENVTMIGDRLELDKLVLSTNEEERNTFLELYAQENDYEENNDTENINTDTETTGADDEGTLDVAVTQTTILPTNATNSIKSFLPKMISREEYEQSLSTSDCESSDTNYYELDESDLPHNYSIVYIEDYIREHKEIMVS